jgi:glutamyl-Q tRNA(Asp) synthetase
VSAGASAAAYVGRFAPSPTGRLHLGSVVAAVASYLDARAHGGRWLLRLDDLDTPRNEPGADAAIRRELQRLELDWDGAVHRQSETPQRYRAALAALQRTGNAYPCGCSRQVLVNGVYPGICRNGLAPGAVARALRCRAPAHRLGFRDLIVGCFGQCLEQEVGDFVVDRADGIPAYHLATVVDDALAGITHVVRGADLLDSTPRQIALQNALGLPTPRYAHLPLVLNAQGQKLSKQNRAPSTDTAPPAQVWLQCLDALGQDRAGLGREQPVAEIKAEAVRRWRLDRVPVTGASTGARHACGAGL